jgi:uncharacterized membrane protein HdeD (DUF308 family)/alpha-beta hydrolase superfamily lysophospholipase
LEIMVWLIAACLLLIGASRLAGAGAADESRAQRWPAIAIGLAWIAAGLIVLLFPGMTIHTLVLVIGVLLLLSGLWQLWLALRNARAGNEWLTHLLFGVANVIFGALAFIAPAATELVLAVLFGLYVAVFGLSRIVLALRLRRNSQGRGQTKISTWPRAWRLAAAAIMLIVALGGLALTARVRAAQPAAPGPFYSAPDPLPAGPAGTLIRSEVMDGFQADATTYRVLYTSTSYDGQPVAVSGVIVVPDAPAPADGRKVVAWTHGTVGVATNCAPSLIPPAIHARELPGLAEFIEAGYIVAATDYQGLGTPGPHPYLVGASEGMNALDSVRAARQLPNADAGADFVVWGESQGGHAALFTGQLAGTYAPELNLRGVVASAPAADLLDLFKSKIEHGDTVGNVLIAMAVATWTQVYDDISLGQVVYPAAQSYVTAIANDCIQNSQQLEAPLAPATLLGMRFFSRRPWEIGAWSDIIAANMPGGARTSAPILLNQGEADQIIAPAVQANFVDKLCAAGNNVEYRTYPGIGHVPIAHDSAPDVVPWIAERFAGAPANAGCNQ